MDSRTTPTADLLSNGELRVENVGEPRLSAMIDALPAAIYTTDAEGRLTHFNAAAAEFSGRTPEVGTDRWCVSWKLYHLDGTPMPHDQCPMSTALREGRTLRGAGAILERPDGERRWFEAYPSPLRNEQGEIVGGINLLVDVTEKKRGERLLQEQTELLEQNLADAKLLQGISAQLIQEDDVGALYEKIIDAAIAISRSDFASMQMLHPERGEGGELRLLAARGFNARASEFWEWVRPDSGSTCGEALRTGGRVIARDVEQCAFLGGSEDLAIYLQTGIRAVQTTPLVSRSGRVLGMISTHWREVHEPSDRDFRLLDILARQAADLIERRQAEERAQLARREAEEANEAKTNFLASMSHELRTPLNAIAGYVDLLELGLRGPLTDSQRQDLDRVKQNQQLLLSLINDVLNFAKIEAGHLEIHRVPVPVDDLLTGLEPLIGPQVRAKGMTYEFEPGHPALAALGDADRIRQVLLNLLTNAVKFSVAGDRVAMSVAECGSEVAIRVADTGPGIPPEKIDAIFDPFVQVDRRRQLATESQQGVGLGLAISRELARAMGGDLVVESTPGAGSAFILSLPSSGADRA